MVTSASSRRGTGRVSMGPGDGVPNLVGLDDPLATDPELAGAKAANLATCAAAGLSTLPGFVVTTAGTERLDQAGTPAAALQEQLLLAREQLCHEWGEPLVVRSSSTAEDLGTSSMAGQFTSVLDVEGPDAFLAAVREVVASAARGAPGGGPVRPMAVLVQRQLDLVMGGVMFGVDPVTGDREHVVVEVVPRSVDDLVSGKVTAAHYVMTRRGRLVEEERVDAAPGLTASLRHRLATLARRAAEALGDTQDVEWAVDREDRLWLLQSRPVTAIAEQAGSKRLFGPGPLAETFPLPLRRLEEDLWVVPLREGIERALCASGAVPDRDLAESPVVVTVRGRPAMDLELTGIASGTWTLRRRISPVQILRRLFTSWRVGRLRVALPRLCREVVAVVDIDLGAIPPLDDLAPTATIDLLQRSRRELATVHQYEVLAGMLLHGRNEGLPTGLLALDALQEAHRLGIGDAEAVSRWPVLLSLTPPSLTSHALPGAAPVSSHEERSVDELDEREALRLRSRWLQELLTLGVRSLARRLAAEEILASPALVRELTLDELATAVRCGTVPDDLADRSRTPDGAPLPSRFRLTPSGAVLPVGGDRHEGCGLPAAPGRVVGTARHRVAPGTPKGGLVLVTDHLDPALAPLLPSLDALVSETGSALSHLAILARETGVAAVVGVDGARRRFAPGARVFVDGAAGEVRLADPDNDGRGELP